MSREQVVGTGVPAMAMAMVAPTARWRDNSLFHDPTTSVRNFVNVVVPTGAPVLLDGLPISGLVPVAGTTWSVARVLLDSSGDGNHAMTSSAKLGISVDRYGEWTSYWYPGGLDLRPIEVF